MSSAAPPAHRFDLRRVVVWNRRTNHRTSILCWAGRLGLTPEAIAAAILRRWGASQITFKRIQERYPYHYHPRFAVSEIERQDIANQMKATFDISVIVTAHHEGRLAHHTMRSLVRAKEFAEEQGLQVQLIVVLDRPDKATKHYFARHGQANLPLLETDFGDPGLARNFGLGRALGAYVGYLDADNLPGQNWLHAAWAFLQDIGESVVAHPEYQVVFEAEELVFRQISMDDPDFDVKNLVEYNYWDTVCLAKREIFRRFPYEKTSGGDGFGFEDWHWNCETIAHGIEHQVVPGTVHFMRSKRAGSQRTYSRQASQLIRPSTLFVPDVFAEAIRKYG